MTVDEFAQNVVRCVSAVPCVERVTLNRYRWPEFYVVTRGSESVAKKEVQRALDTTLGEKFPAWVWFHCPLVKGEAFTIGETIWSREPQKEAGCE